MSPPCRDGSAPTVYTQMGACNQGGEVEDFYCVRSLVDTRSATSS